MKRDNCEFGMNYTSETGSLAKNNSYFDFVELENFACWAAVDETIGNDKQIAIMVVHNLLKSFKQKPTLSQRELNKYLAEAREMVFQIKGNRSLNVGLAVVVTDYTRMVCAVSGNGKIFLFQAAPGLSDEGILEISGHETAEKDFWNISGEEDSVFGSLNWRTFKLQDGDVVLLCNSGLWQKVDQYEIANALTGAKEPYMFLYNLKQRLFDKQDSSLVSYTIAAIFAYRVAKAGKPKWLTSFAALVIFLLLGFGVWHYQLLDRFIPKAQEQQELQQQQPQQEPAAQTQTADHVVTPYQVYTEAAQRGDQYVRSQEYAKALEEYNKAINAVLSDDAETKAGFQKKAAITQLIIAGDKLAAAGANEAAVVKYKAAKQAVTETKDYDTAGLQKRLATVQGSLDVKKGVARGDREFARKNYQAALDAYTGTVQLAKEIDFDTGKLGLDQKIKQTEKQLAKEEAAKLASLDNQSQFLKTSLTAGEKTVKPELPRKSETAKPTFSREPSRQPAKTSETTGSRWLTYDYTNRVEPPTHFGEGNSSSLMADFCTIKDGALVLDSMANPAAGPAYKLAILSAKKNGFKMTVVARVKVNDEYGMDFDFRAVGLRERVRLLNSGLKLESSGGRSGYVKTKDWHTYWFTFEVTDDNGKEQLLTKVYVDGSSNPAVQGNSTVTDTNNYFRIGDCSQSSGYSGEIDWIIWKFDEAGKPGQITLPAGFKFK